MLKQERQDTFSAVSFIEELFGDQEWTVPWVKSITVLSSKMADGHFSVQLFEHELETKI